MRFTRVLTALALAGALLAGCGTAQDDKGIIGSGDGSPAAPSPTDNGVAALEPDAILAKATAALRAAKSFSLKGEIKDEQKIEIDIKVAGDDVQGTLALDGAKTELLRVAGKAYMRPDTKFWAHVAGSGQGAAIAKLMGDRWVKLSAKNTDLEGFFAFANTDELLKPDGTVTKGSTKTINGVAAIGLVDNSKDGGTLWVATTGQPYPLMTEGPAGQGSVTFADFGAGFDITAPDPKDVIDFDQLKGD